MAQTVLLEWEGQEYNYNPKSADWYWTLGIIAVACAIAAILFANFLMAVLIGLAAAALALHGAKRPPTHHFRLLEDGIGIDQDFHPFSRMKSFSVLEDVEGEFPPMLSIKTIDWLTHHLTIPLRPEDADMVYEHFLEHVEEAEHHHTIVDLVADWLGF